MNTKWVELVRLYRGERNEEELVEASHLGAIAVVSGDGKLLYALGDTDNPTHLRSTAKPFQLLPFLLRSLNKIAGLEENEIALLMASHGGEPIHVETLNRILEKIHVSETELACGIHAPTHEPSKNDLIAKGLRPSVLHNNCSGKHCAMVAVAKAAGWSIQGYNEIEHPLQKQIVSLLTQISGLHEQEIGVGIDGCSAATFIMPLQAIATLYAALASPMTGDHKLNDALSLLFSCGAKHPQMIAGTKRLDTMLMRCAKGALFAKTGAEGIYAVAVAPSTRYPHGLGIVMKIADGDSTHRARNAAMIELLIELGVVEEELIIGDEELSSFRTGILRNLRKLEVGKIKPMFEVQA